MPSVVCWTNSNGSPHQHFGKIDSGFSLVFTGFQVSGNWETQKPRNRQHTLSKYLLKFKYCNYIVSISMNSIISFLGFLGFHTSSLWVGFQKTRHRFAGFWVSWFSLVFVQFPWLLNMRNLWKLISLNTDAVPVEFHLNLRNLPIQIQPSGTNVRIDAKSLDGPSPRSK